MRWQSTATIFDINDGVSRVDFEPGVAGPSQHLQIEAFSEDLAVGVFNRMAWTGAQGPDS